MELIQKAYGDAALSRTTIFEWHKRFREGRESVKDDESSGWPTSRTDDNIAAVDKMVKEYLIADTLGIPKTVVLRILREDLNKRKLCSRFGSNNSTFSDSKASRNIEPPTILARFVFLRLLPVPEGEAAVEGCKI